MTYVRRSLLFVLVSLLAVLTLSAPTTLAAETADIGIVAIHYPHTAHLGETLTFRIVAKDYGPDLSDPFVVVDVSSNLEFVSYTCDFGVSADGNFCEYRSELEGPNHLITSVLVVRVVDDSSPTFWVRATTMNGDEVIDPNQANDSLVVTGRIR
jgi:hypothetical protein